MAARSMTFVLGRFFLARLAGMSLPAVTKRPMDRFSTRAGDTEAFARLAPLIAVSCCVPNRRAPMVLLALPQFG
jgi:hypothetical protein